jgi:hypothetical protein
MTLECLYVGKRYGTSTHPSVHEVNADGVLVLGSHFSIKYHSLKRAHFYAANFRLMYDEGKVSVYVAPVIAQTYMIHSVLKIPGDDDHSRQSSMDVKRRLLNIKTFTLRSMSRRFPDPRIYETIDCFFLFLKFCYLYCSELKPTELTSIPSVEYQVLLGDCVCSTMTWHYFSRIRKTGPGEFKGI